MTTAPPYRSKRSRMPVQAPSLWSRSFQMFRLGFALVGLGVAVTVVLLAAQPGVRESAESRLMGWLQQRQAVVALPGGEAEPLILQVQQRLASASVGPTDSSAVAAIDTVAVVAEPAEIDPPVAEPVVVAAEPAAVLAVDPKTLPRAQAKVAHWLSKKYRVAPEPLSVLVAEAWDVGQRHRIDWTLILAVMAVESSFNPFAQSSMGAQGLMQVMTGIHSEKYDGVGGKLAAFDPVTNLRVGVEVLLECIERAGSLEAGLKYYVGAANLPSDNGYSKRVLAERARLKQVAAGRAVS